MIHKETKTTGRKKGREKEIVESHFFSYIYIYETHYVAGTHNYVTIFLCEPKRGGF